MLYLSIDTAMYNLIVVCNVLWRITCVKRQRYFFPLLNYILFLRLKALHHNYYETATIRKIKSQRCVYIKVERFMLKITCSHCIQEERCIVGIYSDWFEYVDSVALARRKHNLTTQFAYLRFILSDLTVLFIFVHAVSWQ